MFSRPVEHVSATKIFARGLEDGRQVLVYSMQLATRTPLAMVLPVPVPPDGPDDAVELVSLERYPELFRDLKRAYPETLSYLAQPKSRGLFRSATKTLEVKQVGAFEASFVPNPRDFTRLDARFRLPPNVLSAVPQYADWGFVVFQLNKSSRVEVHPMAFRFPRRDPDSIFFPTVHVHDGTVPTLASFDHLLLAQLPPLLAALLPWEQSLGPLGAYVDAARAAGLIDGAATGQGTLMVGQQPNRDHWYRSPAGITVDDLEGRGDTYRYRVRASYHFADASHPSYPQWKATASERLPSLCQGLRAGLAELTATHARAWQLAPLVEGMRPHFMNGSQLWSGTDYMHGSSQLTPGPGLVRFTPFTQRVEPQDITLGFAQVPDVEGAMAIDRALGAMLDRAVAS